MCNETLPVWPAVPGHIGSPQQPSACASRDVSKQRDEPVVAQCPKRPLLVGIDDDGVARFPAEDEADHAVVAGRGAGGDALITIDPHGPRMTAGCDTPHTPG